ncbi:MAG: hypothetical protein V2A73_15480, partial [Pseudomonadota bacterium]
AAREPLVLEPDRVHRIEVRAAGCQAEAFTVNLPPGMSKAQRVELRCEAGSSTAMGASTGTGTSAGVGTGVGAGVGASAKGSQPVQGNTADSKGDALLVPAGGQRSAVPASNPDQGAGQSSARDLPAAAGEGEGEGDAGERTASPASMSVRPGEGSPAGTGEGESAKEVGWLTADSSPWAEVLVDGKETGRRTPIANRAKIPLPPGTHKVTLVVGGKRHEFEVVIKAGRTTHFKKTIE